MASAQQKPKRAAGVVGDKRNSGRRNGKAFKKDYWIERVVTESEPNDQSQTKTKVVEVQHARYGPYGTKLSGKGKPSGKSFLGVSYKRIEAQAKALGITRAEVCAELREKRDRRNESRKMHSAVERERQVLGVRELAEARRRKPAKRVEAAEVAA